jgi:hypothetical protein
VVQYRALGGARPSRASCACRDPRGERDDVRAVPPASKKGEKQQMMVTLICDTCNALPALVRGNRTIKIVKALHGSRRLNYKLIG